MYVILNFLPAKVQQKFGQSAPCYTQAHNKCVSPLGYYKHASVIRKPTQQTGC